MSVAEKKAAEVAAGSSVVLVGNLLNRGLRFVTSWALANLLPSAAVYGLYEAARTLITILASFAPAALEVRAPVALPGVALAGLLVGVGTRIGNGCTSGHGVCGIGRLSPRSIVATITFMATGALTVLLVHG